MHNFRRFQQGDKVSYIGTKFAKELHGVLGVVDNNVQGSDNDVVVSFGSEAYVMDATKHLTRFQGKLKDESASNGKDEPKGPEIQKRRGGGGKKRSAEDSE